MFWLDGMPVLPNYRKQTARWAGQIRLHYTIEQQEVLHVQPNNDLGTPLPDIKKTELPAPSSPSPKLMIWVDLHVQTRLDPHPPTMAVAVNRRVPGLRHLQTEILTTSQHPPVGVLPAPRLNLGTLIYPHLDLLTLPTFSRHNLARNMDACL